MDAPEGILQRTNGKMSQFLQDRLTFSILGHCAPDCSSNECVQDDDLRICGCYKLNECVEQSRQLSIEKGNWIQLYCIPNGKFSKDVCWIPKLHHIHWNRRIVPDCDVHVIITEQSTFGVHHFALSSWGSEQVKLHLKSPMWVDELHQKQQLPDLRVCLYNNFKYLTRIQSSWFVTVTCHIIAILLASFFTLVYTILQFFHRFLSYGSQLYVYTIMEKLFSHTLKNIHIRSCQLLYWPILLQNRGSRSQSSMEYAHKAVLKRHYMWSSVAVDVLLGNVTGLALLLHIRTVCLLVMNLFGEITNNLLRSGCVWLMGVPAGFKLNTELAEILGMVSLNAIQIWSTLWFYLGAIFTHFIKGLALSGIFFGLTVPAALTIDMIILTTLHVSTLHWIISFLYSLQIQGLIALWRLFRGQKWNPLRERFDSYNYTVEQHVVGSLLFTPLLLLLPTTSVFYIFFTILNTAPSFICMVIEVSISILHATPYTEIFLWMVRPRRFPSGIWFDVTSGQYNRNIFGSTEVECFSKGHSSTSNLHERKMEQENNERSRVMVSFLNSNPSSLGQIVLPHYRNVFHGVSFSSGISSIHGVLTGKRIPNALSTGLPSTMPWMSITCRDYWRLCYKSVLACMEDHASDEDL
ncbi:hypothetical protein GIB67_023351 [Kingdonia uniflora]|uniref:N-acetylglucosaminyl transferase component n=1 Tax=Kingdonia uniflora TaxID=39325 RepID=A0A7J7LI49_9MAGN|nr:hypothetical protein GIB67_023351 [Kingdonia uniflora]